MIVERLQKLSKDSLINIILDKDRRLVEYKKEFIKQNPVGEIFFRGRKYEINFKEIEDV